MPISQIVMSPVWQAVSLFSIVQLYGLAIFREAISYLRIFARISYLRTSRQSADSEYRGDLSADGKHFCGGRLRSLPSAANRSFASSAALEFLDLYRRFAVRSSHHVLVSVCRLKIVALVFPKGGACCSVVCLSGTKKQSPPSSVKLSHIPIKYADSRLPSESCPDFALKPNTLPTFHLH
jgi:hypothetical protein